MKKLSANNYSRDRLNQSNQEHIGKQKDSLKEAIFVFSGLLALTILIKLPSYFRHLDLADEATFILMAQSIIDGHLPYTELWDIKPPLGFFIFTPPIILFGKSLAAVRLYASIFIAFSGLAVYFYGKRTWNYSIGLFSSILLTLIVALGTAPGHVSEMTTLQQVAIAPLAASLTVISTAKINLKNCILTGIFMGLAITLRPNLIYVALTVTIAIFLIVWKQIFHSLNYSIKCSLTYAIGIVLIIFLNYFPYLLTGYHDLWWNSVVLASLSYADTPLSMLGAGAAQARYLLATLSSWSHLSISFLVWLGGLGGLIMLILNWKKSTKNQKIAVEFLFIFLIATEISILRSGKSFSSYHIQIYPFLALASAFLLNFIFSKINRLLALFIITLSLFSFVPLLLSEYKVLTDHLLSGQSLNHGVSYEIAEYLKKDNYAGEPMFMLNSHIVYWLLDSKPMSKSTTQPYNIVNNNLLPFMAEPGATSESELTKILNKKPQYIIAKYGFQGELGVIFRNTLKNKYDKIETIQDINIYKRKNEK